jgi:predicted dehydrogenase
MKVALLSFAHERAENYARLLSGRKDVELVAADDDRARGRRLADLLGIPVGTVDEALAAGPDAIVVAGTPTGHALGAVEDCSRAGAGLVTGAPGRCAPAFQDLRRLVADGALGTVLTVHAAHPDPAHLADLFDLVDATLGADPAERVYAQGRLGSAVVVSVTYRSGTTACFDVGAGAGAGASSGAEGPLITVFGTTGVVEFEPDVRLLGRHDATSGQERWETGASELEAEMLDRFLAGARTGEHRTPEGTDGLRVLRLLQAAHRSTRTGQPVTLG